MLERLAPPFIAIRNCVNAGTADKSSAAIQKSLIRGVRTLTANIVMEMSYAAELHRDALIGTGVILFLFILLINLVLFYLKGRSNL